MFQTIHRAPDRAVQLLRRATDGSTPSAFDAALAVTVQEFPELDLSTTRAEVNALGERVRGYCAGSQDAATSLKALQRVLVHEENFRGNAEDYYDPENSYVNRVLERRVGLPITLSVVWSEVARSAGIPLFGIGFPGHFLVGLNAGGHLHIVDPFDAGRLLSSEDCAALLRRAVPHGRVSEDLFSPASPRTVAWRMLQNLKNIHLGVHRDDARALKVLDLLVALDPQHPGELRARAGLLAEMGAYGGAIADLEQVLALGAAPDSEALSDAVANLRQKTAFLH